MERVPASILRCFVSARTHDQVLSGVPRESIIGCRLFRFKLCSRCGYCVEPSRLVRGYRIRWQQSSATPGYLPDPGWKVRDALGKVLNVVACTLASPAKHLGAYLDARYRHIPTVRSRAR